ncbi:hypothetical protein R3P38DRAFT_3175354 [Favolaschia claudopus]|uniref:Uncharacterized protein n=1 Tax=Favolaschia claudopus TaxID=2862362 RepID=A0AAW0DCP4_9AGAR
MFLDAWVVAAVTAAPRSGAIASRRRIAVPRAGLVQVFGCRQANPRPRRVKQRVAHPPIDFSAVAGAAAPRSGAHSIECMDFLPENGTSNFRPSAGKCPPPTCQAARSLAFHQALDVPATGERKSVMCGKTSASLGEHPRLAHVDYYTYRRPASGAFSTHDSNFLRCAAFNINTQPSNQHLTFVGPPSDASEIFLPAARASSSSSTPTPLSEIQDFEVPRASV